MCQQSFLSKTIKIISIVSLSTAALGAALTNPSAAMDGGQQDKQSIQINEAFWRSQKEGFKKKKESIYYLS